MSIHNQQEYSYKSLAATLAIENLNNTTIWEDAKQHFNSSQDPFLCKINDQQCKISTEPTSFKKGFLGKKSTPGHQVKFEGLGYTCKSKATTVELGIDALYAKINAFAQMQKIGF